MLTLAKRCYLTLNYDPKLPPGFLQAIMFSVADLSGSGEMITICQIFNIYKTCNLENSSIRLPKQMSCPPRAWRQRKMAVV